MTKRNLPDWILPESIISSESGDSRPRRNLRSNSSNSKENIEVPEVIIKPTNYPPIKYDGKIEYCTEFNDIAESCEKLLNWVDKQEGKIIPIAFDMEWPFSFKTGPGKSAVIQLCAEITTCYVYHLTNLKKLPAILLQLLTHKKVKLHGVNIKNDFRKLERDFPEAKAQIMIDQCLDLGVWCNNVCNSSGRFSMERLVLKICKLKIDKNKAVRMSQWHVIPLNQDQLMYAAIDVYISQIIYQKLEKMEITQKYGFTGDFIIPEYNSENQYPIIDYTGIIKYYHTLNDIANSCEEILNWVKNQENNKIIPMAFDLEWKYNYLTGPCKSTLIKIYIQTDICILYHLYEIQKLPKIFIELLTNEKIIIYGVYVKKNLYKLLYDFPEAIIPSIIIDKSIDLGNWNNNIFEKNYLWNINDLAIDTCKVKVNHDRDKRMDEWNIIPLNDQLKLCAANEIYISQVIYYELEKREKEKEAAIDAFVQEFGDESLKAVNKLC